MENKIISKETKTVILSALLLVVGILFCFSTTMGINALSYIIGIGFIFAGAVSIINSALKKKTVLNYSCVIGTALLSFGIFFAEYTLATILFFYVPWLLVALGAIVIADGILNKVTQNNNVIFLSELIVGVLILALGICLKFIPGFIDLSAVMLGIVMIACGIYLLVTSFVLYKN